VLVIALALLAAQPRLGVVDATAAGAPDLAAAVAASAQKLNRFDVQTPDVVDKAVAEARKVGAACGIDDGPDCWARLGILSELDRILVLNKSADRLDLLLVDVPARSAARSSMQIAPGALPAQIADDALAALLSGQAVPIAAPKVAAPHVHGPLFYTGAYGAAFGAVVLVGCGGGALGVSSQLATRLVQARDQGVPLDDKYRGLNTSFIALGVCTGVAALAGVGGGVLALVDP
jgi:hypothetical protein